MEQLIANQHSKKATHTTPHIISVFNEHSERLLKLESLCNTMLKSDEPQLPAVTNQIEQVTEPEPVIEPEPEPKPVIEPEPEPEPEHIIEPQLPNPLISELTNKLSDLSNQNVVLNDEINTLTTIEDDIDDSISDLESVCTDDCRQMIEQNADIVKCGSWHVDDEVCSGCIKTRAKAFKREKKRLEKERAKQLKEIKQKQKDLLKLEQKQLQTRLKNIKKNRNELTGIDTSKQEQMRDELKRIADDYQRTGSSNAQFNVQMFV